MTRRLWLSDAQKSYLIAADMGLITWKKVSPRIDYYIGDRNVTTPVTILIRHGMLEAYWVDIHVSPPGVRVTEKGRRYL